MKKTFAALAAAVVTLGLAYAQLGPNYHQVVQWQKFLGKTLFVNENEFDGRADFDGAVDFDSTVDFAGATVSAITLPGATTVSGALTLTGGFTSPLTVSTLKTRVYHGTKTLTEGGAAETILTVTNATTEASSGTLYYHIRGTDATDHQSTVGTLIFTLVNKAGTVTSSFLPATIAAGITQESATQALSSGTLTGAFDSVEAANSTVISIDIDSSLTLSAASLEWVLVLQGPGTVS